FAEHPDPAFTAFGLRLAVQPRARRQRARDDDESAASVWARRPQWADHLARNDPSLCQRLSVYDVCQPAGGLGHLVDAQAQPVYAACTAATAHGSDGIEMRVAFLGLGVMGYPMAGHLKRAGHDVT